MPFRPPKKPPQFADLKGILAQYKEQDNALYHTIEILIERLDQLKDHTEEQINQGKTGAIQKFAPIGATYHTKEDETVFLPNSWQLIAGSNITFDDSIPNKRRINSTGGGGGSNHYDSPLSDGNLTEADLIYANGECIIVQVPL